MARHKCESLNQLLYTYLLSANEVGQSLSLFLWQVLLKVNTMKPITTAAIIAILASQAHAFNHVWYWCGKSTTTCENEGKPWNGVYPTYDCGHKLKWDNYRQAYGKWYQSTDEWDDWEKKGGFKDCCHAAGKGACYSYQE